MVFIALLVLAVIPAAAQNFSFRDAQALLKTYCVACHQGKTPPGGLNLTTRMTTEQTLATDAPAWNKLLTRVRNSEMPPKGAPAPSMDQRAALVKWLEPALHAAVCAGGITPGPNPIRRLNRNEYAATIRDLLNIHINAGHALPADGAGGEGFDNAAETLFLSPIHAEKYLEAAKEALDYGAKDPKSRATFLIAEPSADTTPEEAARKILRAFLPRAFRQPAGDADVERYLALFRAAQKRGDGFDQSIRLALATVLVSPRFLFRVESGDYQIASRLAYFLWGSMPDAPLFELAAQGKLRDPATLDEQVARMLKDQKSREFAERFVEQWLGTRELGRDIKPDATLFPAYYNAELQSAIRYEPVLFFQEILAENLSLVNLLDSKFTILTNRLQRHYGLTVQGMGQQPKRAELPENSHRGGVLTMAAVLAVSSYPQRTSPVLRGKWILETILGTPPPPPPANVPALKENHEGAPPRTLRERLLEHRNDPVCASCHDRIDPLGFALENYDVLGRWRTEDAGKPIESAAELPDGTHFEGPDQLKAVLLERKEVFLRSFTARMLGYALGRGLTLQDSCAVDQMLDRLRQNDYSAHTLIREIVRSAPFLGNNRNFQESAR